MTACYPSVKAAIGAAARISQHMSYPRGGAQARVQSSPDRDHLDASSAVRACLARAGVDPHGDDAQILYRWATTTDRRDGYDDAAEGSQGREREQALEEGRRVRARLAALLEAVEPALVAAGVVVRDRVPKLEHAWRVAVHDGRPRILRVLDPRPDDPSLIYDLDEARKVALGMLDDSRIIRTTTIVAPVKRPHGEIRDAWVARWEAGEWPSLHAMDACLAENLGCSRRWASTIRSRWGLHGSMGRRPTSPALRSGNLIPTQELDGTGVPE